MGQLSRLNRMLPFWSPQLSTEYIDAVNDLLFNGYPVAKSAAGKIVQFWDYPVANHNNAKKGVEIGLSDAAGVIISGGVSKAYRKPGPEFLACRAFATWNRAQSGLPKQSADTLNKTDAADIIMEELTKSDPATMCKLFLNDKIIRDPRPASTHEFFLSAYNNGHYAKLTNDTRPKGNLVIVAPETSAFRIYVMARHILSTAPISIEMAPFKEIQYADGKSPNWYDFKPLGPKWVYGVELRSLFKYTFENETELAEKEARDKSDVYRFQITFDEYLKFRRIKAAIK